MTARSARDSLGPYLAPEHSDLVTQDEDLGVLGAIGPGEQGELAEYPDHRQISEPY
jgi:hypothetical protein